MNVIRTCGEGSAARLQVALLRSVGQALNVLGTRGFGRFTRMVGEKFFHEENFAIVSVGNKAMLKVYLNDYYWTQILLPGEGYEPEVKFVLSRLLSHETIFLDCGANIGHWSCYATDYISSAQRIIAIEASTTTFMRLMENRKLNQNGFTAINGAIDAQSGLMREFTYRPGAHAGSHLSSSPEVQDGWEVETVKTVTIDNTLANIGLENIHGLVVIKLDVEGAETAALKGAQNTLANDAVIVYEDHGADLDCSISRYVMQELGYQVFSIENQKIQLVVSLDAIAAIKRDRRKGYNFVACRPNSVWIRRLIRNAALN